MSKPAQGGPTEHKGAAPAAPQQHQQQAKPAGKGKGESVMPGGCHATGCKGPEKRFTFCEEHYEQFKFGLIKKSGDPVPDYEKKFEHYQAYKARSTRKVA